VSDETEDRRRPDTASHAAAQFGAAAAANAARAADRIGPGWAAVEDMLRREANKLNSADPGWGSVHHAQARGNVFEALNDLHDNVRLAEKGQKGEWVNTRLNPDHSAVRGVVPDGMGANRIPQDSVLVVDGRVILGRQDKLLCLNNGNIRGISHEKYAGLEIVVPSDQVEQWRIELLKLADQEVDPDLRVKYLDAVDRIRGGVARDDITSAIADPDAYRFRHELKAFGKEAAFASASTALAAGVVSGTVSSIRNGIKLYNGEITGGQAAGRIAGDAAGSMVRGGGQAALGVAIRTGAARAGVAGLANGAAASTMAGAVIETGRVVYDLAMGRTSPEKAMESLGETGCVTIAGLYAGGAAATLFGKVGVVQMTVAGIAAPLSLPVLVASTASCIAVAAIYQSCLQIFKTARLEKDEAERVMALAAAAEEELRLQREAFELAAEAYFQSRQEIFDFAFAAVTEGFEVGDLRATMSGLAQIASTVGAQLQFETFEDFESFMVDSETVLVL
jgi:hypothetical protein